MIPVSMACPLCRGALVRREVEPDLGADVTTYTIPQEHVVRVSVDLHAERAVWWICTNERCRVECTAAELVASWGAVPIIPGSAPAELLEVECGSCHVHYAMPPALGPMVDPYDPRYPHSALDAWISPRLADPVSGKEGAEDVAGAWGQFVVSVSSGRYIMCPFCARGRGVRSPLTLVRRGDRGHP